MQKTGHRGRGGRKHPPNPVLLKELHSVREIPWEGGSRRTLQEQCYPVFSFIFHVCLVLRETEHEPGRGREREGDAESEAGSRLWAVSTEPDSGLEPTDREITI